MAFLPQNHGAPRLFWLLPAQGATQADGCRLARSGTGIAAHDGSDMAMPRPTLLLDEDMRSARFASGATRSLLPHSLPSQVATCRMKDETPVIVMLDIVLAETTEAAWLETERLIAAGLPAETAASALIGTPQEITRRIGDYRAFGVTEIVLAAPLDRAPIEAVRTQLLPLLGRMPRSAPMPRPSGRTDRPCGLTARVAPPT